MNTNTVVMRTSEVGAAMKVREILYGNRFFNTKIW